MRKLWLTVSIAALSGSWGPFAGAQTDSSRAMPSSIYKQEPVTMKMGFAAYRESDFAKALSIWTTLAEGGNADAQYYVGHLYGYGLVAGGAAPEAFEWYSKAAQAGQADAQEALGSVYRYGTGDVEKSLPLAIAWYKKAAAQDNEDALTALAELGQGLAASVADAAAPLQVIPQDEFSLYVQSVAGADVVPAKVAALRLMVDADLAYENGLYTKALGLWEQAAQGGDPMAQYSLGNLYFTGKGVNASEEKAYEWYQKAARSNLPEALNRLGYMHRTGRAVPESKEKAIGYFKRAAELGYGDSFNELGNISKSENDYAAAIGYYQRGAALDDHWSLYSLGVIYENGQHVQKSYTKALQYYRQMASNGQAIGMSKLGDMYRNGRGVAPSQEMAQFWYMKAARLGALGAYEDLTLSNKQILGRETVSKRDAKAQSGDAFAQYDLGSAYELGHGVTQSATMAAYWYKRSMEQGSALAKFALAELLYEGQNITPDKTKARAMFIEMARQREGDVNALQRVTMKAIRANDQALADPLLEIIGGDADAEPEFLMMAGLFYGDQYHHRKNGKHQISDMNKSIEYLKRAANMGHRESQYFLAGTYDGAKGNYKGDNAQARIWYAKASAQGDANSTSALARLYDQGLGGSKNSAKAVTLYKLAADQGHENAAAYAQAAGYHHKKDQAAKAAREATERNARARRARAQQKKVTPTPRSTYRPTQKLSGWRGGLFAFATGGAFSSNASSYSNNRRSYSTTSSRRNDTSLYGNGINTSKEYHVQQWLKSPSNYYQNRYKY